jgi:surface antigen
LSIAACAALALVPLASQAAPNAGRQAAKPQPASKMVGRAAPIQRSGPILQCVTFARDRSGIHLSGNANTWWHSAAGRFDRGQRPEAGAVLSFPASGGMRMGHVSVVSRVVSAREILIDDANWAAPGQRKGMVRRGASVIDVSPGNDWTEVRVANGIGSWGRVYPTYGFIYPRADRSAPAERIEFAAARPLPAPGAAPSGAAPSGVAPSGVAPSRNQPAAATPGWVWTGGLATALAGTTAGTTAGATTSAAPPPMRWTWSNGRAVALD